MKRLLALLLAFCLLLSACTVATGPDAVPSAPAPSDPVQSDPVPSDYVLPDYSAHREICEYEDSYVTVLADLKKLSQGERALALEVGPADWIDNEWDGEKSDTWGYDMRSCDVSGEDLSGIEDWNDISFNSDTLWPSAGKLPEGFDPETILELGKDPGLGIRELHDQGITGEGVGIAIIDQGLYSGHEQYKDNLMLYESFHTNDGQKAAMHGSALASIAVGKDVGVAPGAKLYYIACDFGHVIGNEYEYDLSILADSIYRVLEINRNLPQGEKIRVISISFGPSSQRPGYWELVSAVKAAKAEGILVLTVQASQFYPGFEFLGMCRESLADPNDPQSYGPAAWLADKQTNWREDNILVPMGGRTYAGCTGESDYEWNYEGGMSWAVPWLAGFYALCCQANPDCTADQFFRVVQDTAVTKLLRESGGQEYCFGRIIDPAAVIKALKDQ